MELSDSANFGDQWYSMLVLDVFWQLGQTETYFCWILLFVGEFRNKFALFALVSTILI